MDLNDLAIHHYICPECERPYDFTRVPSTPLKCTWRDCGNAFLIPVAQHVPKPRERFIVALTVEATDFQRAAYWANAHTGTADHGVKVLGVALVGNVPDIARVARTGRLQANQSNSHVIHPKA